MSAVKHVGILQPNNVILRRESLIFSVTLFFLIEVIHTGRKADERRSAITAARELGYGEDVVERLKKCDKNSIARIMKEARMKKEYVGDNF